MQLQLNLVVAAVAVAFYQQILRRFHGSVDRFIDRNVDGNVNENFDGNFDGNVDGNINGFVDVSWNMSWIWRCRYMYSQQAHMLVQLLEDAVDKCSYSWQMMYVQ